MADPGCYTRIKYAGFELLPQLNQLNDKWFERRKQQKQTWVTW